MRPFELSIAPEDYEEEGAAAYGGQTCGTNMLLLTVQALQIALVSYWHLQGPHASTSIENLSRSLLEESLFGARIVPLSPSQDLPDETMIGKPFAMPWEGLLITIKVNFDWPRAFPLQLETCLLQLPPCNLRKFQE